MSQLLMAQAEPRCEQIRIRSPPFNGLGDVELFIEQFGEVAAQGRWSTQQTLLKLREVVGMKAHKYTWPTLAEGIFEALRLRYSLTPEATLSKLAAMRWEPSTSIYEHASEIQRLVAILSVGANESAVSTMACMHFRLAVRNAGLQRHLLGNQD